MEKGKSKPYRTIVDAQVSSFNSLSSFHDWSKSPDVLAHWLERFTNSNSIVSDFFCGGGTVPAVCKMLGRNYIAFEIDPDTAERARERVRNTQPPLFVLQPEQSAMEFVE